MFNCRNKFPHWKDMNSNLSIVHVELLNNTLIFKQGFGKLKNKKIPWILVRIKLFQCLHCEGTSIVCDVPYSVYSCGNVRDSVPRYILSNDFFAFYIPCVVSNPWMKIQIPNISNFFLYWLSCIIVNFDLIFLKKVTKEEYC